MRKEFPFAMVWSWVTRVKHHQLGVFSDGNEMNIHWILWISTQVYTLISVNGLIFITKADISQRYSCFNEMVADIIRMWQQMSAQRLRQLKGSSFQDDFFSGHLHQLPLITEHSWKENFLD